jgi:hypothetical protein
VAAIRSYLLGAPASVGNLLPFDFVLASMVGAVALIPLLRPSGSKNKKGDLDG